MSPLLTYGPGAVLVITLEDGLREAGRSWWRVKFLCKIEGKEEVRSGRGGAKGSPVFWVRPGDLMFKKVIMLMVLMMTTVDTGTLCQHFYKC